MGSFVLNSPRPWARVVAADGSRRSGKPPMSSSAWLSDTGGWGLRARGAIGTPDVLYSELRAIGNACTENSGELLVLSDSQSAILLLQRWIEGHSVTLPRVWNPPMVHAIQTFLDSLHIREGQVRFEWVRGHAGHPLNEGADALASLASRARRDRLATAEVKHRAEGIAEAFSAAYARTKKNA
jgi:ribonuclease HI